MKVSLGSDHRGYELKEQLKKFLSEAGYEVNDEGTSSSSSADYPVYAEKVALRVSSGKSDKGILLCGSGFGMCMAANKVRGIRAAAVLRPEDAALTVRHNNTNILCLGADSVSFKEASSAAEKFLGAEFEGGRHARRVNQIKELEAKH